MSISVEEVRHVARLARLELEEVEILALQGELNALLGHFSELHQSDLAGIEPSSHVVTVQNVWSEDAVGECLPRADALKNAPVSKAGLFVVPQILEG